MIDVLRIAHLRIAPQEGNLEVGNCEGNLCNLANQSFKERMCKSSKKCNASHFPCLIKIISSQFHHSPTCLV